MGEVETGLRVGSYRRVVVAASVGTFIENYDLVVYGYLATVLAGEFFPRQDPTAALLSTFAIFAVGFVVRPVGGLIFGYFGDRIGRKPALAVSLLLMTVATLAFGLLPTYREVGVLAPVLLLVCRLLQGLSASAEIPGASLLILEHAARERRGRAVAVNNAAVHLGIAAAAGVALILAQLLSAAQLAQWGWRVAFLAAAPIGLVGLYVRTRVLETPAFVALGEAAKRGRVPLVDAFADAKRGMLVLIVWLAAVSVGGYLLNGFLPSYLIRVAGMPPAAAFTVSLTASLVGAVSAMLGGYLIDRFALRRVAVGVMAGLAVTAVPAFLIISRSGTLAAALIAQCVWAAFLGASLTIGHALSVVLFPVAFRYTAAAVGLSLATTLFGSTAPYVATWLVATTESPIVPGVYFLVIAVGALLAARLGLPRQRLGEIAAPRRT